MGMTAAFRPEARRQRLLVSRLEAETVVYDLETHEAHCLNPFASRLWAACDGGSTVAMMRRANAWPEREVEDGLRLLSDAGLLREPLPKSPTRRRALGRLAQAAALPAVVSIMVPAAASAQSCIANGGGCNTSLSCCSSCCKSNGNPANRNFCVNPGPGQQCYNP